MVKKRATSAPDDLSLADKKAVWAWIEKETKTGLLPPWYKDRGFVRKSVNKCLLHHSAKGTEFVNWLSATKNWILKQAEFDGWKTKNVRRRGSTSRKQGVLLEEERALGDNLKGIEAILNEMDLKGDG